MDIDHEEKLLLMEVQTLAAEMMTKAVAVLSDENENSQNRRQMALSLALACRDLGQFLPEGGDWLEDFGDNLEWCIQDLEERYEKARCSEDRRERIVALAYLRVVKRLRRRLTDPRRRQSLIPLIYTDPLYPPGGVLPPGVTFPVPPEGYGSVVSAQE